MAWEQFEYQASESSRYCNILESSGLSWRFPLILKRLDLVYDVYSILLLADRDTLHKRLQERHFKRTIDNQVGRDEAASIDWVLENLDKFQFPIDKIIRTERYNLDELYQLFNEEALSFFR